MFFHQIKILNEYLIEQLDGIVKKLKVLLAFFTIFCNIFLLFVAENV
jgi:hypothetical protein